MFLQLTRSIHDAEKVLNVTLRKMKARAVSERLKVSIDERLKKREISRHDSKVCLPYLKSPRMAIRQRRAIPYKCQERTGRKMWR